MRKYLLVTFFCFSLASPVKADCYSLWDVIRSLVTDQMLLQQSKGSFYCSVVCAVNATQVLLKASGRGAEIEKPMKLVEKLFRERPELRERLQRRGVRDNEAFDFLQFLLKEVGFDPQISGITTQSAHASEHVRYVEQFTASDLVMEGPLEVKIVALHGHPTTFGQRGVSHYALAVGFNRGEGTLTLSDPMNPGKKVTGTLLPRNNSRRLRLKLPSDDFDPNFDWSVGSVITVRLQ